MPLDFTPIDDVIAYSYIRFSHPAQAKGNSLDRQIQLAEAYCQRRRWKLSTDTYRDLGVSARKGKNALVGNLGEFLKAVQSGAVKPGSALIVESIDRISREGIDAGWDLIKKILKAGIRIVTLSPEREFDIEATRSLSKGALEIQLILERAAEESERKEMRLKAAWDAKRVLARKAKGVLTQKVPDWLEAYDVVRDNQDRLVTAKFRLIPAKVSAVQRVFQLSAIGYGAGRIVRKVIEEGIPPISKRWTAAGVRHLLLSRTVLGEFQMKDTERKPIGDPVPNYYPPAIDETLWLAARSGVSSRRRPGKKGSGSYDKDGFVNPFVGLLHDARNGGTYVPLLLGPANGRGSYHRVLRNVEMDGRDKSLSFPYESFRKAVLGLMKEIDPAEIIGGTKQPDESAALEADLERTTGQIEKLKINILNGGDDPELADVLRQLSIRKRELGEKLQAAKAAAATPLAHAWQDAQTLLGAIQAAPDRVDATLRFRANLKRIVTKFDVLVVPQGAVRWAFVQCHFVGGRQRFWTIRHKPPVKNKFGSKPGRWWAMSRTNISPFADMPFKAVDLTSAADQQRCMDFVNRWRQENFERAVVGDYIKEIIPA